MENYRLTIQPVTPFASEIQSDTLFGQCLWILKYMKGDKYLNDVLNKIKNNTGFFILSSAYRHDKIELPLIPMTLKEDEQFKKKFIERKDEYLKQMKINDNTEKYPEDFMYYLFKKKDKNAKKYIELNDLNQKIKIENIKSLDNEEKEIQEISMRNVINRFTGTTQEDSLFYSENYFFNKKFKYFIYIKTDLFTEKEIKEIFENLGKYGYGADTSIGRGQFEVIELKNIKISEPEDANYIISLSNYIPAEDEVNLENSYYSILFKKGKLGCEYAYGIDNKEKSFFKTPFIMIKNTSLLQIKTKKSIYGRIVDNINYANKNIIHTGQTFALKINIDINGG